MTNTIASLTLRKGDNRYYVDVDGVKVGWVIKSQGQVPGWAFYATVDDAFEGRCLAYGMNTRRDALMEGLSNLRIRHLGRVIRPRSWENGGGDESVFVSTDSLQAIWERLLDEKYPLA